VIARHQVALFLHLMKTTAQSRFVFVPRKVNIDALARLGITSKHAKSLVMALTPDDYVSGPDPDHNNPGRDVWVFGAIASSQEVYVKLQVIIEPSEQCVCISFHLPQHPMRYPLRQNRPPIREEER
jgi:hypothetical protein